MEKAPLSPSHVPKRIRGSPVRSSLVRTQVWPKCPCPCLCLCPCMPLHCTQPHRLSTSSSAPLRPPSAVPRFPSASASRHCLALTGGTTVDAGSLAPSQRRVRTRLSRQGFTHHPLTTPNSEYALTAGSFAPALCLHLLWKHLSLLPPTALAPEPPQPLREHRHCHSQ